MLKDTLKEFVLWILARDVELIGWMPILKSLPENCSMDSVMEEVFRLATESEPEDRFDNFINGLVFTAALSAAGLGYMPFYQHLWTHVPELRSSAKRFEQELGINFETLEKNLNKDDSFPRDFQEFWNKDPEACANQPENNASRQIELLRFIFEEGGRLGFRLGPSDGKELLGAAVRYPETFVYLLENAPRYAPDPADRDGGKVLEIAASLEQMDILRILIEESSRYGFTIQNEDFVSAVGEGAAEGHLSTVRYLIETGEKVGFQIHPEEAGEILRKAMEHGQLSILRYLVEESGILQETPLILARDAIDQSHYDRMLPYLFDKCRTKGLFLDCRALDWAFPRTRQSDPSYERLYRQVRINVRICTLLEHGTITRPEADLLYTSGATDHTGIEEMLEKVESKLLSVEEAVRVLQTDGRPGGSRRGKI